MGFRIKTSYVVPEEAEKVVERKSIFDRIQEKVLVEYTRPDDPSPQYVEHLLRNILIGQVKDDSIITRLHREIEHEFIQLQQTERVGDFHISVTDDKIKVRYTNLSSLKITEVTVSY